MSRINGDKARFHRERKQRIQRREENRVRFSALVKPRSAEETPVAAKAKEREA